MCFAKSYSYEIHMTHDHGPWNSELLLGHLLTCYSFHKGMPGRCPCLLQFGSTALSDLRECRWPPTSELVCGLAFARPQHAGIMLDVPTMALCPELCWRNVFKPNTYFKAEILCTRHLMSRKSSTLKMKCAHSIITKWRTMSSVKCVKRPVLGSYIWRN